LPSIISLTVPSHLPPPSLLDGHAVTRRLHSFPTRRSSDLLSVIVELGAQDGRTGVRTLEDGLEIARAISRPSSREHWRTTRSPRSEEHTSELQSRFDLVCRLLLEKKNTRGHSQEQLLPTTN